MVLQYRCAGPARPCDGCRTVQSGRVGCAAPAEREVGLPGVRPRDTYRPDNQGEKVDQCGSEHAEYPCARGELRLGTAVPLPYALAILVPVRRAPATPGRSPQMPSRTCH